MLKIFLSVPVTGRLCTFWDVPGDFPVNLPVKLRTFWDVSGDFSVSLPVRLRTF